jgi:protein-S-isoprenylcysteine O-methyltransferase Ste14
MRRFGMTLMPAVLIIGVMISPIRDGWFISITAVNAAWFFVEFFIAVKQDYHHIVPKHILVSISRIGWLAAAALTILDSVKGPWITAVPDWVRVTSIVIILLSVFVRFAAFKRLGRLFSYDVRITEGHSLVTDGMYGIVRHPAYTAICMLGSLTGLAAGSLTGFVLMAICTVPQTIYRTICEEQMLEAEFGKTFREYRERTFRLFPFIY